MLTTPHLKGMKCSQALKPTLAAKVTFTFWKRKVCAAAGCLLQRWLKEKHSEPVLDWLASFLERQTE